MTLWIINLTSTHSKLSKNVYVYCIIPSSLFTMIYFKWAKTVHLQELRVSFCGVLNELTKKLLTKFFEKSQETGKWQKNDQTERARPGRKTRKEVGKENQMTALRFQTGV